MLSRKSIFYYLVIKLFQNISGWLLYVEKLYRVSQKKATIQIQISAVIQTTYCSVLKFIIGLNDECVKNTQFYTHVI